MVNKCYFYVIKINCMKVIKVIVEKMNELFVSYQVYYQNLCVLYWNIKGQNFFELYLKYEELYICVQEIIDELVECIFILGIVLFYQFLVYFGVSKIFENEIIIDGKIGMKYILEVQEILLKFE